MARQNISLGSAANDGTGTAARPAGQMLNANFLELHQLVVATSTAMAYVEMSGDDSSGVIGDRNYPFLNPQAAYDAIVASTTEGIISLGIGSFQSISLTSGDFSPLVKSIIGRGATVSIMTGIYSNTGGVIDLSSDHSCNLGAVMFYGGAGTTGEHGIGGSDNPGEESYSTAGDVGGQGQAAGKIRLRGCTAEVVLGGGGPGGNGGNGGTGGLGDGDGGTGGTGGDTANLFLINCIIKNYVLRAAGAGGMGGYTNLLGGNVASGPDGAAAGVLLVVGSSIFTAPTDVNGDRRLINSQSGDAAGAGAAWWSDIDGGSYGTTNAYPAW